MGLPAKKVDFNIAEKKDLGRADTLRYNVMSFVVEENYDRAIQELKSFASKDSDFPKFKEKSERFIMHATDLVNAIRVKRRFPGMNNLTAAKQQEINDSYKKHFDELQYILKKIEKIQNDLKLEDVRSTVYVIKAIVNAMFGIFLVAFLIEVSKGLFATAWVVVDDMFIASTNWIFKSIGF